MTFCAASLVDLDALGFTVDVFAGHGRIRTDFYFNTLHKADLFLEI